MKPDLRKDIPLLLTAVLSFIYFGYYVITMTWTDGGGDTFSHYTIARYAFTYPENLLDHWGKPLFTLFAAPFAQFGLKGVEFFNVFCGLLAGVFAALTARSLGYKQDWLGVVFTLFAPVMYTGVFSALTEPLAACVLIAGVAYYAREKYWTGSIILSFLIMIRTEVFIFYPLFTLFLIGVKQYKAIAGLLVGFVVYSFAGWSHYNDFFWIITQQPYGDASAVYGSGNLLHFVDSYDHIIHQLLSVLFFISLFWIGVTTLRQRFRLTHKQLLELLILLLAVAFFAAHSLVWWLGIGASFGLLRVMMVIVPLVAVLAIKAIQFKWIQHYSVVAHSLALGFVVISVWVPIRKYVYPIAPHPELPLIESLKLDAKSVLENGNKIGFYHPYIGVYFNLDYKNREQAQYHFYYGIDQPEKLNPGDIYIWDSHFGANEGGVSVEMLEATDLELLQMEKAPLGDGKEVEIRLYRK